MPAPKGHPRWGGRQKGKLNHSTIELFNKAGELKIDVWVNLLGLCTSQNEQIKLQALKIAMEYLYQKRKAIESDPDDSGPPIAGESKELKELKNVIALAAAERKAK